MKKLIKLTAKENKLYDIVKKMGISDPLFVQYTVHLKKKPFIIDFAYPSLSLGFCAKNRVLSKEKQELQNLGWDILYF